MVDLKLDSKLAEKVIEIYAARFVPGETGLSPLDSWPWVSHLMYDYGFSEPQANAVFRVLTFGTPHEGFIDAGEKAELETYFPHARAFIDALAGDNGARAFYARTRWLAENAVTSWWRVDYNAQDRTDMLAKLAACPSYSLPHSLRTLLMEAAVEDDDADVRRMANDALKNLMPSPADAPELTEKLKEEPQDSAHLMVMLSAMRFSVGDRQNEEVVDVLMELLSSEKLHIRESAITMLGFYGPYAAKAVPALQTITEDTVEDIISGRCGMRQRYDENGPVRFDEWEELGELDKTEKDIALRASDAIRRIESGAML